MHVLLVAATSFELKPLLQRLHWVAREEGLANNWYHDQGAWRFELLVTGVGMVNTALLLGRRLQQQPPDLMINIGVCGSLDAKLPLTRVVEVREETYPELGAEDGEQFLDLAALGFALFEYRGQPQYNTLRNPYRSPFSWQHVTGLTGNTVHGEAESIQQLQHRWPKQVESMEGAACFQAGLMMGVPFFEIRAISNYVEPRNLQQWRLKDAIAALNNGLQPYLTSPEPYFRAFSPSAFSAD
jgi:futalosine hydrolase